MDPLKRSLLAQLFHSPNRTLSTTKLVLDQLCTQDRVKLIHVLSTIESLPDCLRRFMEDLLEHRSYESSLQTLLIQQDDCILDCIEEVCEQCIKK